MKKSEMCTLFLMLSLVGNPIVNATEMKKEKSAVDSEITSKGLNTGKINKKTEKTVETVEIEFGDSRVEQYVRDELYYRKVIPTIDAILTKEHMKQLKKVSLYTPTGEAEISELKGLEFAENLKEFRIYGAVTDYSYIYGLNNLEEIDINDKLFSDKDLSSLTLTNLKKIYLKTSISHLKPIRNCSELNTLSVTGQTIDDLSPISDLIKLEQLYLSNNEISDLNPLANLTELSRLNINNNNISDVSVLANLNKLDYVNLQGNHVYDISMLENQLTNEHSWGGSFEVSVQDVTLPEVVVTDGELELSEVVKHLPNHEMSYVNISDKGKFDTSTFKWINLDDSDKQVSYWFRGENFKVNGAGFNSGFSGVVTTPIRHNPYTRKISFKDTGLTIKAGVANQNLLSGLTAVDEKDGDISKKIQVISHTINFNKEGVYSVTYLATNSLGKKAEYTRDVKVIATQPTIQAQDRQVREGEIFNPLIGVSAVDDVEGDITNKIEVKVNTVDTSTLGSYKVTFTVTNKFGKSAEKSIKVDVIKGETIDFTYTGLPKTIFLGDTYTIKSNNKVIDWVFDKNYFEKVVDGKDKIENLSKTTSLVNSQTDMVTLKAIKLGKTIVYATTVDNKQHAIPVTIIEKPVIPEKPIETQAEPPGTENTSDTSDTINSSVANLDGSTDQDGSGVKNIASISNKKNLPKTNEKSNNFVVIGINVLVISIVGWYLKYFYNKKTY